MLGLARVAELAEAADLVAALTAADVRVLVRFPEVDPYLPPAERALLETAAADKGHRVALDPA